MLHWIKNNVLLSACLAVITLALVVTIARDAERTGARKDLPELPAIATPASFTPENGFLTTIESLDAAYAGGFRYFLIHMSLTADEKLVCMRNWQQDAGIIFTLPPRAAGQQARSPVLSENEFNTFATASGKRPCTLATLAAWLGAHKDAVAVIQAHDKPVVSFGMIRDAVPAYATQILPEAPRPQAAAKIHALGYRQSMLLLPDFAAKGGKTPQQKEQVQRFKQFLNRQGRLVYAVRLPGGFFKKGNLPDWLKGRPVPLYASNVGDCGQYAKLRERGVSGMVANSKLTQPCTAAK